MGADIGTAYVHIEPTAKGISGKIEKEFGGTGKSAGQSFSTGFGSVIGGVGKVAIAAVGAAATAVGGVVSSAVSNFGEYEQLVGGVETLFGDAAQTVIDNADAAFQTAGMSANNYMQTVTSFSASLLQSLGGDAKAAAKTADMALIDMSDNANKMGTSMESIQNAYQGFAKQNYTMLDNLKLGYGGTKTEMERLLADATKLTGVKYDISNLSDVYNAIHAIQDNLGITGTTAKEAATTIQGSAASMKAAWENLLTGMGTQGADVSGLIDNLVQSVQTFAGNVMPVIQTALQGVSTLVSQLAPVLAAELPALITSILPQLLASGVQVVEALGQGILQTIPSLLPMIGQVASSLTSTLLSLLPQLLQVGTSIILELAQGITSALPTLIPTLTHVALEIVTMLTDPGTLTSLVQAGLDMILALGQGVIAAIPELTAQLPTIVQNICDSLTTALPLIIDAAIQLTDMLVQNLPTIMQALIDSAPQIIESLCVALVSNAPLLVAIGPQLMLQTVTGILKEAPQLFTLGRQLIDSLIRGLASAYATLTAEGPKMLKQLYQKMLTSLKQFLEVGKSLVKQIIEGLKQFGENLYKQGTELMNKLKEKIIGAIKGFAEIGKNIVNGIKEGLASAWADLEKWFTEKIGKLKEKVKDVLKIESPSKVFADEIGRMIPLGIAEGIEDGMNALDTSVLDMTAGIVGTADRSIAAATYQPVSSNGDVYSLLATYLPEIAKNRTSITLEGGIDRFFRAIQSEARRNRELTGATI